jgi:hypothetical protein
MNQDNGRTTVRVSARRIPISAECTGASRYGLDDGHRHCRGNGPIRIPHFTAPVLPATRCACPCHTPRGDQ